MNIKDDFKIHQLKLEYFYTNDKDVYPGMPVSTSLEIIKKHDFKNQNTYWEKIISHKYISFNNSRSINTNITKDKLYNYDDIINKLEKIDLRDLKNNYFIYKNMNEFSYWSISYNDYFKIIGTFDNVINEFKEISDILDFKKIMDTETKKVKEEYQKQENEANE